MVLFVELAPISAFLLAIHTSLLSILGGYEPLAFAVRTPINGFTWIYGCNDFLSIANGNAWDEPRGASQSAGSQPVCASDASGSKAKAVPRKRSKDKLGPAKSKKMPKDELGPAKSKKMPKDESKLKKMPKDELVPAKSKKIPKHEKESGNTSKRSKASKPSMKRPAAASRV